MSLRRRDFLKLTAAGPVAFAAAATLPTSVHASAAPDNAFDDAYGVLVDTTFCIGCRKCEWGCNEANDVPRRARTEFDDKSVTTVHRRPDATAYTVVNQIAAPPETAQPVYAKVQCMHCNRAGLRLGLHRRRAAQAARGAGHLRRLEVHRLPLLHGRLPVPDPGLRVRTTRSSPRCGSAPSAPSASSRRGASPACVEICPNEALTFGTARRADRRWLTRRSSRLPAAISTTSTARTRSAARAGCTWPASISRAPSCRRWASRPIPELTETIQHGIFKNFVPPLALLRPARAGDAPQPATSGEDGGQSERERARRARCGRPSSPRGTAGRAGRRRRRHRRLPRPDDLRPATATNLDDQYPWGIWIAIDVATGVALAAGGFTTAALVAHLPPRAIPRRSSARRC